MRVRFIQSIAGSGSPDGIQFPFFHFPEGFVGNIPEQALAEAWIASGICVAAEHGEQCRPHNPEFAVAVSPEVAMARRGRGRPAKVSVVIEAETTETTEPTDSEE
jgi:hypothetical protein